MVRRLILTGPDLAIFGAIERHGPLPSRYLYEFVRRERRDYSHFQKRLTEFYNGDEGGPYLARPPQQFAAYAARYQHLVYDLTPRARHALAEAGGPDPAAPSTTSSFVHQLMQACVCASFELSAASHGLRYISRTDILRHPRFPATSRAGHQPFALLSPGRERSLIPDDVFGLEYPDQGFRFFALEIDRNTESITRTRLDQTAFARKVEGYLQTLSTKMHLAQWGLPNLHILTVTTNARHAENLRAYVARTAPAALAGRFAFMAEPSFGANWRVPQVVLSQLVREPWMTPAGLRSFSRQEET